MRSAGFLGRVPIWALIAFLALIVGAVIALWVLILTGTIGKASNWPWALAAGAIPLISSGWRRRRRRR